MMPSPGYVYYISDDYFKDVNDPYLLQNKGIGHGRPCYCCEKSPETGLYWMIPLSSQRKKFREKHDKTVSRYGRCTTIVLGQYADKGAAFVIQNAFPVTEKYVERAFVKQQKPMPVQCKIQRMIYKKFQNCLSIHKKGVKIFYTDIYRAEHIMIEKTT